jgi:SAM-dependent methyltransferase
MPLANALLTPAQLDAAEPRYPLDLCFCPDCALVQITETVPPEVLFGEYLYFSSFSETMLAHAKELVSELVAKRRLTADSLVVEIASNDGYLLQYFEPHGVPVLGIEPAANIARVAVENGVPTRCEFFGAEAALKLREAGQQADVILGLNVLAHVADLNGFVAGVKALLKPDGVAVFEFPYVADMIRQAEFDTIYHEHLCYYSLSAIKVLFERHQLTPVEVARLPLHGGSLRVTLAHDPAQPAPSVLDLLTEEAALGVTGYDYYRDFGDRVQALKEALLTKLATLKGEGCRLAAYGAAAKATVLLNYFGIGAETLEFVADRSDYKRGRYIPGVRLPITPPEKLLEAMPDYVLLLTWNFAAEILQQQAEYRRRGGRFIVPIPKLEVV